MNKLFIVLIGTILLASAVAQTTCTKRDTDATKNCAICNSDSTTCTTCQEGYGKVGTACVECNKDNCMNCDGAAATCKTCDTGYGVTDAGACVKCSSTNGHCDACDGDSPATCTDCATGYGLLSAGTCSACTNTAGNCDKCDGTVATCTKCKPGYSTVGNDCANKCNIDGCAVCVAKESCTQCKEGYVQDASTITKCTACPSGCDTCTSGTKCTVCSKDSDLLSSDGATCSFGAKATVSFALVGVAILALIF